MSANRFRPHVYVLPEDDANRQIANGFLLDASLDSRAIQVLPCAGGWAKVRDEFAAVHTKEMRKCQHRHMVLLVDFDEIDDRAANVRSAVPDRAHRPCFRRGGLIEARGPESRHGQLRTYRQKSCRGLSREHG